MKNENNKPPNMNPNNKRYFCWLWMYISKHYQNCFIGQYNSPNMTNLIKIGLKTLPKEIIEIQQEASLLPAHLLSWIKDDEYQIKWLFSQLSRSMSLPDIIKTTQNLDKHFIIGLLDLLDSEAAVPLHKPINIYIQNRREEKQKKLIHLNEEWEKISQPQKILEWFNNPNEPERIKAGWQIFRKRFPHYTNPFNEFENYLQLLEKFDEHNIQPLEREIFVTESRKRHSQNKSRAKNTHKKQLNVVLPIATIDTLDKISKKYDLPRGRVIEILLQKEKEKGIYISEKMRQERDIN